MSLFSQVWNWNITSEEKKESFPCDKYAPANYRGMLRGINIYASANIVFRWICQIKIAPYSYDWIDNGGRQSPRKLSPGLERLEIGQNFLIGRIVEFEEGSDITCVIPEMYFLICPMSITYKVRSTGLKTSRIIVKIDVGYESLLDKIRGNLLAIGDLIMMRKQLVTLKELAELEVNQ
jgi:hypothetical protein